LPSTQPSSVSSTPVDYSRPISIHSRLKQSYNGTTQEVPAQALAVFTEQLHPVAYNLCVPSEQYPYPYTTHLHTLPTHPTYTSLRTNNASGSQDPTVSYRRSHWRTYKPHFGSCTKHCSIWDHKKALPFPSGSFALIFGLPTNGVTLFLVSTRACFPCSRYHLLLVLILVLGRTHDRTHAATRRIGSCLFCRLCLIFGFDFSTKRLLRNK
jgi:hypothetical protein